MDHYLKGIILAVFGSLLLLVNMYLVLRDYQWAHVHLKQKRMNYLSYNIAISFLSLVTIVGGIVYLFMVNTQLS
ncbi:hypothetical protein [Enterococcus gilvus]|uniref:hypothetical protein n=1 Tax=Enterococcus gilvus TaxID=160453 RepID=UPI001C8C3E40|nr:hypothetical protein [Enterococcus gilvus]MBX8938822.1 hypothetical protein [Enterococcus gilvus]